MVGVGRVGVNGVCRGGKKYFPYIQIGWLEPCKLGKQKMIKKRKQFINVCIMSGHMEVPSGK